MGQPKTPPQERSEAVKKDARPPYSLRSQFLNLMVHDHKKAIAALKDTVDMSTNAGVRDYAKNTIPMLQRHLKDAQELQNKMDANEKH